MWRIARGPWERRMEGRWWAARREGVMAPLRSVGEGEGERSRVLVARRCALGMVMVEAMVAERGIME